MKGIPVIKPPAIALGYFVAAFGLQWLIPWDLQPHFGHPIVGAMIGLAGGSIMAWACVLFQGNETPIRFQEEPKTIVEVGPYNFTRNPMYLGITLILLGIGWGVGTIPLMVPPAAFILTMQLIFIPFEEARMERLFGNNYLNFKQRVRRWI